MSTTNLAKRNNFLIATFIVVILVGGLFVYTFKGIFNSLETSYQVENVLGDAELRINKTLLENAYISFYEREVIKLEIVKGAQTVAVPEEKINE